MLSVVVVEVELGVRLVWVDDGDESGRHFVLCVLLLGYVGCVASVYECRYLCVLRRTLRRFKSEPGR